MQHIDSVWIDLITKIMGTGFEVHPRGMPTMELLANTTVVDMGDPILTVPERELGYRFLAAEAHWILSGDNRVETIAPYSKQISRFSDDGVRFFGAYGPKVMEQMSYVVRTLGEDNESRQAVMTIWRERPGPTKDVPCSIALQFMVRNGKLNCHATMRSSDAWLGWVYDVFNFSMISWAVLLELKQWGLRDYVDLEIGKLYLTAASQHLYKAQWDKCGDIIDSRIGPKCPTPSKQLEIADARLRPIRDAIENREAQSTAELLRLLDDLRTLGADKVLKP